MAKKDSMAALLRALEFKDKDEKLVLDTLRKLAASFEDLDFADSINKLEHVMKDTEQQFHLAAKAGTVASKDLVASNARLEAAQQRVAGLTEKLQKGDGITIKEVKKLNKEIKGLTNVTRKEHKLIAERERDDSGHFTGRRLGAKAFNRIRGDFFSSQGRQSFMKKMGVEPESPLMAPTRGGFAKAAIGHLAKGGARAIGGKLVESEGLGGMVEGLGGGPMALAAGAAASLVKKGFEVRKAAAVAATLRTLSYGTKGGRSTAEEIKATEQAIVEAKLAAAEFNGDMEASLAALTKIASETGTTFDALTEKSTKGVSQMQRLEKLRFMGLGTMDELSEELVKVTNDTGKTTDEVLSNFETVAEDVHSLIDTGIQGPDMTDYFKAVMHVSQAVDSLSVSQTGLSKIMKLNVKTAHDLQMSYNRTLKAAQGLTEALVSNYDEGFATIDVYSDVAAAMKSTDKGIAGDSKWLMDQMRSGMDPEMAAQFEKQMGLTTSSEVATNRLQNTLDRAGSNPRLLEAQLGRQITPDEYKLLQNYQQQRQSGKSMQDIQKDLEATNPGGGDKLDKLVDEMKTAQPAPEALMHATLDQLMASIAGEMDPAIKQITSLLSDILTLINSFRNFGAKENLKAAASGAADFVSDKLHLAHQDTPEEIAASVAKQTITRQAQRLLGASYREGESPEDMIAEVKQQGLLDKLHIKSAEEKKALETYVGPDEAQKIFAQSATADAAKKAAAAAAATPAAASMTLTGPNAAGDLTATVKGKAVAGLAEQQATNEQATGRVGATP